MYLGSWGPVVVSTWKATASGPFQHLIVVFDNRRMGAISSSQASQYADGRDFATSDDIPIDFVRLATAVQGVYGLEGGDTEESLKAALAEAYDHDGLSLVHVPVYWGHDPLAGMGAYGR